MLEKLKFKKINIKTDTLFKKMDLQFAQNLHIGLKQLNKIIMSKFEGRSFGKIELSIVFSKNRGSELKNKNKSENKLELEVELPIKSESSVVIEINRVLANCNRDRDRESNNKYPNDSIPTAKAKSIYKF